MSKKKTKLSDHFSVFKEPERYELPETPQCEILVNKQKRKYYGKKKNKLYLNDGDYIQISLSNPSYNRIGVQLEFNGNKEEKMVVLNPGQKILLDRFVDTKKKIKYETYFIDGNDPQSKESIKFNGDLIVHFWKEKVFRNTGNYIGICGKDLPYYYHITYEPNTNINTTSNTNYSYTTTSNVSYDKEMSDINSFERKHRRKRVKMKETGRLGKGKNSKQKMKEVDFDPDFIFHVKNYKLLPVSEMKHKKKLLSGNKPISVTVDSHNNYKNTDHRIYCSNPMCGYRVRNRNWKFCPICGNDLD